MALQASSNTTTAPPPPWTARGSTKASTSSRRVSRRRMRRFSTGSRPRAQPLAVHDAHAAQARGACIRRGTRPSPRPPRRPSCHAGRDGPGSPSACAAACAGCRAAARAQVRRVVLDLRVVVGEARELGEDRLLVLVALGGNRRRRNAEGLDALAGRAGHALHRAPEEPGRLRASCRSRFFHPRLSRYLSASSAAMQPVPALVTAWR